MNKTLNILAFSFLTILWLAFGVALVNNPGWIHAVWAHFRAYPFLVQVVIGVLVLPVLVGLWVWESSLAFSLRLILVAGLAFATIYIFFPRSQRL